MKDALERQAIRNKLTEALRAFHEVAELTGKSFDVRVSASNVTVRPPGDLGSAVFKLDKYGPHDDHGLFRAVEILLPRNP